jgi:hypothetical protein
MPPPTKLVPKPPNSPTTDLSPTQNESSSGNGNSGLQFIVCGGPSDEATKAAKREVRAQAARRSADQRRRTIAQRYGTNTNARNAQLRVKNALAERRKENRNAAKRRRSGERTTASASASPPSPAVNRPQSAGFPTHSVDDARPFAHEGVSHLGMSPSASETWYQQQDAAAAAQAQHSPLDSYNGQKQHHPGAFDLPNLPLTMLEESEPTIGQPWGPSNPYFASAMTSMDSPSTVTDFPTAYSHGAMAPPPAPMAGIPGWGPIPATPASHFSQEEMLHMPLSIDTAPMHLAGTGTNMDNMPGLTPSLSSPSTTLTPSSISDPATPDNTMLEPTTIHISTRPPLPLPAGLAALNTHQVIPGELLNAIATLSHVANRPTSHPDNLFQLQTIGTAMMTYRYSMRDNLAVVMSMHLRLAAGLLLQAMAYMAVTGRKDQRLSNSYVAGTLKRNVMEEIDPACLVGVGGGMYSGGMYDEALLWALSIICIVESNWQVRQMAVMQRLVQRTGVISFEEYERLMQRYVCPHWLRPGIQGLWNDNLQ